MGDGITPCRSPSGYPVNSPPRCRHPPSSSRCPANPFQTDERTSWKPKVGRRRRRDPPPPGRILAPPRCQNGTWPHRQGCSWGLKDAPGDRRMLPGMGERRMLIFSTCGWRRRLDGSPHTPGAGRRATPPPLMLRVPPSPQPCPWGARRFLLVNRMFSSACPPAALACSLASVSWYGRPRGSRGGR